nr:60S ribosomal protein L18a-like protein [Arachis hypogaea]
MNNKLVWAKKKKIVFREREREGKKLWEIENRQRVSPMGIGGTTSASCSDEGNMPPYYGTFQGVANFYPPQPSSSHNSYQGYTLLPVYAVLEGHPIRERRLPCCGLGLGWCLFILGFFLGGIPWYFGTFLLLCTRVDYREKPGLIACTIVSLIIVIAITLGSSHRHFVWWT